MNAFHATLAGFSTMKEILVQICFHVEMAFEIPGKTVMMQTLKTEMGAISTVKLKLAGLAQVEIWLTKTIAAFLVTEGRAITDFTSVEMET